VGCKNPGVLYWARASDNNSGVIAGDTFGNGVGSLHWYDFESQPGIVDYNIGRVLVINATWQLPTTEVRACIGGLGRERLGTRRDSQGQRWPTFHSDYWDRW